MVDCDGIMVEAAPAHLLRRRGARLRRRELARLRARRPRGYVRCGVLGRVFAHLQCEGCQRPLLVAFSCGSRAFCPSCLGRRMCQGALNLLTYVLPTVPLRQWVLTLPFELRAPLAYQRDLMGAVARIFADSVMGWYRRRLAPGVPEARGGVVTVIQRSSSDMKLNPHLHAIAVPGGPWSYRRRSRHRRPHQRRPPRRQRTPSRHPSFPALDHAAATGPGPSGCA